MIRQGTDSVELRRAVLGNLTLIGLRLLLALVSLVVLLLREFELSKPVGVQPPPLRTAIPLYLKPEGLVVLIVLALTVFYAVLLNRRQHLGKLLIFQVLLDIGLISALVYDTGGAYSPFIPFYLVSLAATALVVGERWVWNAAALAGASFTVIAVLYGLGVVPSSYAHRLTRGELGGMRSFYKAVQIYLLPLCALFLVAALAGRLAGRLAHTELLHAELLAGLGEGVMLLDRKKRPVYLNSAFERLLGRSGTLEELRAVVEKEANLEKAINDALTEGRAGRGEFYWRRSSAELVHLATRVRPLLVPGRKSDDKTAPKGVLIVFEDISAEKKMKELQARQKRVEALGRLAASLAHEIRNPLASIRGAVQELGRVAKLPEEKRALLEIVMSESDRLNRILSDFLRFARLPSPRPRPVEVPRLLEDLKMLVISRADAAGVEVRVKAEAISGFTADQEQLHQALLNLCTNALQALQGCRDGEIVLRARKTDHRKAAGALSADESAAGERPGVLFEVADNGCGMAPEVRAEMFEPFFTTKSGGGGLGLAVVSRIMQGHGGIATVRSETGRGTIFRLWFPMRPEPAEDSEAASTKLSTPNIQ